MKRENIILVGYMGCGKSTFGKKIANALRYQFKDADNLIELKKGKSIVQLFEESGEQAFRNIETDFIKALNEKNIVLATGGGMPCYNENMDLLNKKGITIYLERPAKELVNRLSNAKDKSKRPLIASKTNEELLTYISEQLKIREAEYLKADIILSRETQNVEDAMIILNEYLN